MEIIELDTENLFDKNGIDPVGNLFRTSGLGKMTEGLFKISGDMRYFLDISSRGPKFFEDANIRLWKMIIGEKNLNREIRRGAYSFCSNISNEKHIPIFNGKCHNFHSPKYEIIIKDAILFFS